MGRCRCFPVALRKLIGLEPEDDDNVVERPEELINRYVRLMTATANITSGLGTLALLWSTVVLLGGFVAVLGMKDFWTLTLLSFLLACRYACTKSCFAMHLRSSLELNTARMALLLSLIFPFFSYILSILLSCFLNYCYIWMKINWGAHIYTLLYT